MTSYRLSFVVSLILLIRIAAVANEVHAQSPSDSVLTQIIRERVESGRSTGMILGLIDSDGIRRVVSWSGDDVAGRGLDVNTVFEIGSMTKPFVGILLAQMASSGDVGLDDPVSLHLPAEVKVPTRNGRHITLVDLSSHGSSLPNSRGDFNPKDPANPYADYTRNQLFELRPAVSTPRWPIC